MPTSVVGLVKWLLVGLGWAVLVVLALYCTSCVLYLFARAITAGILRQRAESRKLLDTNTKRCSCKGSTDKKEHTDG